MKPSASVTSDANIIARMAAMKKPAPKAHAPQKPAPQPSADSAAVAEAEKTILAKVASAIKNLKS